MYYLIMIIGLLVAFVGLGCSCSSKSPIQFLLGALIFIGGSMISIYGVECIEMEKDKKVITDVFKRNCLESIDLDKLSSHEIRLIYNSLGAVVLDGIRYPKCEKK